MTPSIEIFLSGNAGVGDVLGLALVALLWVRAGVVFVHANGRRPFILFYLLCAAIVTVGCIVGLTRAEGDYYAWVRVLWVSGALATHEWAAADDWRPWRWRL